MNYGEEYVMNNEFIIFVPPDDENDVFCITLAGITYKNPDYRVIRNNSKQFTLEYVISGEGTVVDNTQTYHVAKGDMYMLQPGANHYYYSSSQNPWEKIWINAHGTLIENLTRTYGIHSTVLFEKTNGYPLLKKAVDICCNHTLSASQINNEIALIFQELVILMSNCVKKTNHISKEANILKNYLNMHINENITISELSRLILRSESQTIRIFKKYFNDTPYEYLMKNKIYRAKTLLQNTNMKVKDIAFSLGFCDEHYFSKIFKQRTFQTPKEFRQNFHE